MEQYAERLSQLEALSPEDLESLESELVATFDEADNTANVELMQQTADALDQVRSEMQRRGGETDETPEAEVAEGEPAGDVAEPVAASAEGEGDAVADESDTEANASVAEEPETNADLSAEPETETESAPDAGEQEQEDEVSNLTADDIPEENQPTAVSASAPIIRVGGDVPGFTAGAQLADMDEAIEAMTAKVNTMRGVSGDGEHVLVASIRYEDEVPEDRILRPGDADGNGRKIRQLISDPEQLTAEALTAAGWCAPKAPVYDVPTIGTTDRPIRSALPSFTADRGGIVWMEPPSLAGIVASDADRFAVWDLETDKPCWDVPCGSEATATVEALTMCLCFDNLMSRAFPEWVRANTELVMVAQARWAERYLLQNMWGSLTSTVGTPDIALGATRDFLTALRVVAAQFRWVNRLSPTQPLQLAAPNWLHEAMAADLAIQAPGDNTLSTSYGEIDGYLSDLNVQPIWYIDDLPTGSGGSPASSQDSRFDTPLGFPAVAEWLLYPTGTFVRLDNGSLDLGVVRTKEDVQQNKYCEFSETFEAVAYMGPASPNGWAIRGRTTVEIIGSYADATDTGAGSIGS